MKHFFSDSEPFIPVPGVEDHSAPQITHTRTKRVIAVAEDCVVFIDATYQAHEAIGVLDLTESLVRRPDGCVVISRTATKVVTPGDPVFPQTELQPAQPSQLKPIESGPPTTQPE